MNDKITDIDKPITNKNDDEFGRNKFVNELASLIENYSKSTNNECLTLDINGEWGEGKTSVVNLLKEKLKNDEKYKFIDFNPWSFSSNKEDLNNELYKIIIANIKKRLIFLNIFSKNFTKCFECFILKIMIFVQKHKTIFVLICIISILFIIFLFLLNDILQCKKYENFLNNFMYNDVFNYKLKIECHKFSIVEFFKENWEFLAFIIGIIWGFCKYYYSLLDKKDSIKPLLKFSNIKYILVVDDIDRLNKDEVISLFNFIKSNLDLDNFIFIFLYERNLINAILNEHYKQNCFLEKIITLQTDLPDINLYNIENFFSNHISEIIGNKFDLSDILLENCNFYLRSNIINPIFKKNIRKIKRFLNQFKIDYYMIKDCELDIDNENFIFIEIIKHFENELYNFIKNNPYEFIEDKNENGTTPVDKRIVELNKFANDNGYTVYNKNSRYFENDNAKFIDEKLANIKQKVIDKENFETIIIILNYLFPYTKNYLNLNKEKHSYSRETRLTNKISDYKSFYKYFELDIDTEEITQIEYNGLKEYFDNYELFIEKFQKFIKQKKDTIKQKQNKAKNQKSNDQIEKTIINSFFNIFEKNEVGKFGRYKNNNTNIKNLIVILIYLTYNGGYNYISVGEFFVNLFVQIKNIDISDIFILLDEGIKKQVLDLGNKILFINIHFYKYLQFDPKEEKLSELKNNIKNIFDTLQQNNITENYNDQNFVFQLYIMCTCIINNEKEILDDNIKKYTLDYLCYIMQNTNKLIELNCYDFIVDFFDVFLSVSELNKDFKEKFFNFLIDKDNNLNNFINNHQNNKNTNNIYKKLETFRSLEEFNRFKQNIVNKQ